VPSSFFIQYPPPPRTFPSLPKNPFGLLTLCGLLDPQLFPRWPLAACTRESLATPPPASDSAVSLFFSQFHQFTRPARNKTQGPASQRASLPVGPTLTKQTPPPYRRQSGGKCFLIFRKYRWSSSRAHRNVCCPPTTVALFVLRQDDQFLNTQHPLLF